MYNYNILERKEMTGMEILICTTFSELFKEIYNLADNLLCKNKSRYVSVSPISYQSENTISATVKKYNSAIIILDIDSFKNWKKIVRNLEEISKSIRICLISRNAEPAVEAINNFNTICGYIYRDKINEMFREIFSRFLKKLRTICGGIAITHYNTLDKVIPFNEILFIETVKQTHICTIVHKHGEDTIRANISDLIDELPCVFLIVRASTIANMSEVKSFSDGEMFFSNGSCCFYNRKLTSEIITFMKQPVII